MLYEAATGVLPLGAFAPPSEINRAYGRAFDRIVMQLLQSDPARRPGAAAEVAMRLASALAPRRRARAIAVSAAALAVVLAGGTVGLRAMRRGGGGKSIDEKDAPTFATKSAPARAPAAPGNAAPTTDKAAAAPEPTELLAAPETEDPPRPRTKSKTRLVLKAVSDVKKLRTTAAQSPPQKTAAAAPPAPKLASKRALDGAEVLELQKLGKGAKAGKPQAKSKLEALSDTEFDRLDAEIKDAVPARTGAPPRSPDAGAPIVPTSRK
jgi:hypothetical protein